MIRRTYWMLLMLLSSAFALGCDSGEVKPQEGLTPEVSQEEINKQIQEGMKQGGMEQQYQGQAPGSGN